MTEQSSFLQILSETLQHGGVFLFVEEGMTSEAKELLQILRDNFSGRIPFLAKKLEALTSLRYRPQLKDLLFVGQLKLEDRQALAIVCRAQIVSQQASLDSLQDVTWDANRCSVADVVKILEDYLRAEHLEEDPLEENARVGAHKTPALFLDRDDVIVKNIPYNKDPGQVTLLPGIVESIRTAHDRGQLVIVCSNQSGLGRGMISAGEFHAVHQRMLQLLAERGAWVEDSFWASYIPNAVGGLHLEPQMRKPRPGMFLQAAHKWNIDMGRSTMVGDRASDLIAAFTAGVGNLVLLAENPQAEIALLTDYQRNFSDFKFKTLASLAELN